MKPSGLRSWTRAVAVVALLASAACSRGGSADLPKITTGDVATQNTYARTTATFVWPAGFQADPTGTACAAYSTRCARTRLSPRVAVSDVSTALSRAGLPSGALRCGNAGPQPMDLPGLDTPADGCAVTITHGLASMRILAWNRFTLTKATASVPARSLDLGYTAVSIYAPPVHASVRVTVLPPSTVPIDSEDRRLVARWGPLTCWTHVARGCTALMAQTHDMPDPVAAARKMGAEFLAAGFGIESATCQRPGVAAPRVECSVMALRQHTPTDPDIVSAGADFANDQAGSVEVFTAGVHD